MLSSPNTTSQALPSGDTLTFRVVDSIWLMGKAQTQEVEGDATVVSSQLSCSIWGALFCASRSANTERVAVNKRWK